MRRRLQTYEVSGITVTAETAETATAGEVAAQVEHCPCGALQYQRS